VELKAQRGLSRVEAAEVTGAVFSYFRWRGWLKPQQSPGEQILDARALAQQFAKHPEAFSDDELVAYAVPGWIQNEIEITPGFARALQSEPQLWLRARPGQGRLLASQLGDCRGLGAGPLSDTLSYHGQKDLFRMKEFHCGSFELQDVSSQAVGLVCAPIQGETWWDACAGEGGKLLHLSDLMSNKGLIWGSDRAEWRLRRLKRRAARAHVFNYRTTLWDGGEKLPTKTKFDGVLVDAPCSGTGTWQRNPDARWTLTAEDLKELKELQLRLLCNSARALKPGGKLVYSVCSVTRSETVEVAELLGKTCANFERVHLKNPLKVDAPSAKAIQLLPQEVKGNGMFVAAWSLRC
jgi:16S rRNA (cytosine967-C5)-methyltransferase